MKFQKVISKAVAGGEWKDLIKAGLFLILSVVVFFFLIKTVFHYRYAERPTPHNFMECLGLGYPIRESYPRQCDAGNGVVFVENIRR